MSPDDDEHEAAEPRLWREQRFQTRDAVTFGPFFGPATGGPEDAGGKIVPGGWDHEHCRRCSARISDQPGCDPRGFTDGEDWLCPACYPEVCQRSGE